MGLSFNSTSDKFSESEVNGRTVRFYPVSFFTLRRLRGVLAKLASAFGVLLSGGSDLALSPDRGRVIEQVYDDKPPVVGPDGLTSDPVVVGSRVTTHPISADLAKLRDSQRQAAIQGAIDTLLDDSNALAIGELLMSSMRDEVSNRRPSQKEIQEFIDQIDAPTLIAMLIGVVKGNASIFGDAGEKLGKALRAQVEQLLAPVAGAQQMDGGDSSEPSSS